MKVNGQENSTQIQRKPVKTQRLMQVSQSCNSKPDEGNNGSTPHKCCTKVHLFGQHL